MSDPHERRHGAAIVGANGMPTKFKLQPLYAGGPLQSPVTFAQFPPNGEGEVLLPVYGGATRMETVASELLGGSLSPANLLECGRDPSYRKTLIDAAVLTAWDLIAAAGTFRGPKPDEASDQAEPSDEAANEAAAEEPAAPESPIILP